jgi:hypothetical protein
VNLGVFASWWLFFLPLSIASHNDRAGWAPGHQLSPENIKIQNQNKIKQNICLLTGNRSSKMILPQNSFILVIPDNYII